VTGRLAALLVGLAAFCLYYSTLLPGFDFGDSASFQVMAGSPSITPRDAYPLYFALARPLALVFDDAAYALNVTTALEAALACALIVLVATELSGAVAAGVASALLFAGSYTFWSQAVIAEVYALHTLLIALTLYLLLRWEKEPGTRRLSWFLAAYALSFGNHLTMVLLAPSYALFLLVKAPGGWRSLANRRIVTLALVLTTVGSFQYLWNLQAVWRTPLPPASFGDALAAFWFDVTKADWRSSMVGRVPSIMAGERLRMYGFDIWQQFGWVPPAFALAGAAWLFKTNRARAWLMIGLFAVTTGFALTYNVGDSHVFFLPSHLMVALMAAPGIVALSSVASYVASGLSYVASGLSYVASGFSRTVRFSRTMGFSRTFVPAMSAVIAALAICRAYRDYPALDRSQDTRPREVLEALTSGLDDQHAIFLADLNWQIDNGLNYFAHVSKNDLAVARLRDVWLHAPALIRDNREAGRDIMLDQHAATSLTRANERHTVERDARVRTSSLAEAAGSISRGTRYVLCVLKPTPDATIDGADLNQGLRLLIGADRARFPDDYAVYAGVTGESAVLVHASKRPFTRDVKIGGVPVTIRMDSWLAFDTIRRMGFGHVIAARRHTLIVERGVSFVTFDANGRPLTRHYWGNIFESQPRYRIR
jgi:hypothetical protein